MITLQQRSPDSGLPSSLSQLDSLISRVQALEPNADIYWHMTWAYQQNSNHPDFPRYNSDQMTMYKAITQTAKNYIKPNKNFKGIIPSGAAIQNFRTSYLGDTLTRDGYHLSLDIGRFIAGLAWYAHLTGGSADNVKWAPNAVKPHLPAICEAVSAAVKTPFEVTQVTAQRQIEN